MPPRAPVELRGVVEPESLEIDATRRVEVDGRRPSRDRQARRMAPAASSRRSRRLGDPGAEDIRGTGHLKPSANPQSSIGSGSAPIPSNKRSRDAPRGRPPRYSPPSKDTRSRAPRPLMDARVSALIGHAQSLAMPHSRHAREMHRDARCRPSPGFLPDPGSLLKTGSGRSRRASAMWDQRQRPHSRL